MTLIRSFPRLAFALVLLSIIGYGISSAQVGVLLISGALAVLSWYVTEGPRGRHLPKWASNILLLAVVLYLVVDWGQHRQIEKVMLVLGRFTIWLMLIKLYEQKSPRDYAQLLGLSLLLILTCCFLTTDLLFGIVLLAYMLLGLYVLVLFQLFAAQDVARERSREAAPTGYRLVPAVQAIIGRQVGFDFRSLVVGIGIVGFAISAFVFVAFPRSVGQDMASFMPPSVAPTRTPGFSQVLNPARGTRISNSRSAAVKITVRDGSGRPTRLAEPVLLRGQVFDWYMGGGEWARRRGRGRVGRVVVADDRHFETLAAGEVDLDDPRTYTLDLEWYVPYSMAFSVYAPVAISTDETAHLTFDPRRFTMTGRDGERLRHYQVKVQPRATDRTLRALSRGAQRPPGRDQVGADLAGSLTRLTDVARSQLADAGTATAPPTASSDARWRWSEEAARVIEQYFDPEEFSYTLDLSDIVIPVNSDPIMHFALEAKRGHCEYYAAAYVLMCQLVGIEARVVSGYVAWDYDEEESCYHVVQGNAHAWAEVRVDRERWISVDPTPAAVVSEIAPVDSGLAERVRWFFNGMESRWDESVIAFDSRSQQRLGETLDTGWLARIERSFQQTREQLAAVNRSFHLGPAGYIWMGIVALAVVVAIVAVVRLIRRRRSLRRALALGHLHGSEYERMLRQLGFYLDMLMVLYRAGIGKPSWQPPLRYAAQLSTERPDVAPIVDELTRSFYRARYGHQSLTRDEVHDARDKVQQLARALGVRV